jgi:hypothetical protein
MGEFELPYDRDLSKNTPAQIQRAVREGVAADLWSVGDKTAIISGKNKINGCAYIIGFNHNSSIEGTGITFQYGVTTDDIRIAMIDSSYYYTKNNTSYIWCNMNLTSTNIGGWAGSGAYGVIATNDTSDSNSLIWELSDTGWVDVIANTVKYTDNTGGTSNLEENVTATTQKLFLLSEYEIWGSRTYANSYEQNYQQQYAFYANGGSKKRYRDSATSSTCAWFTRSPAVDGSISFSTVTSDGSINKFTGNWSLGWSFAFRVA